MKNKTLLAACMAAISFSAYAQSGSVTTTTTTSYTPLCSRYHGMKVMAAGGEVGTVDDVIIDSNGRVVSFAVGTDSDHVVMVPYSVIEVPDAGATEITVSVDKQVILSSPTVLRTELRTIQPEYIERSYTSYGLSKEDIGRTSVDIHASQTNINVDRSTNAPNQSPQDRDRSRDHNLRPDARPGDQNARVGVDAEVSVNKDRNANEVDKKNRADENVTDRNADHPRKKAQRPEDRASRANDPIDKGQPGTPDRSASSNDAVDKSSKGNKHSADALNSEKADQSAKQAGDSTVEQTATPKRHAADTVDGAVDSGSKRQNRADRIKNAPDGAVGNSNAPAVDSSAAKPERRKKRAQGEAAVGAPANPVPANPGSVAPEVPATTPHP